MAQFTSQNRRWEMPPPSVPPAPVREGWDAAELVYVDGPFAGVHCQWALVKRSGPPERPPACSYAGCLEAAVFNVVGGGHTGCSLATCEAARVRGSPCDEVAPKTHAMACEQHGGAVLITTEGNAGRLMRLERRT